MIAPSLPLKIRLAAAGFAGLLAGFVGGSAIIQWSARAGPSLAATSAGFAVLRFGPASPATRPCPPPQAGCGLHPGLSGHG